MNIILYTRCLSYRGVTYLKTADISQYVFRIFGPNFKIGLNTSRSSGSTVARVHNSTSVYDNGVIEKIWMVPINQNTHTDQEYYWSPPPH